MQIVIIEATAEELKANMRVTDSIVDAMSRLCDKIARVDAGARLFDKIAEEEGETDEK